MKIPKDGDEYDALRKKKLRKKEERTFSFWMTLFPPAWHAAQLPANTWAPLSRSAAKAAGAMDMTPTITAAAICVIIRWKLFIVQSMMTSRIMSTSSQATHSTDSDEDDLGVPCYPCSSELELSASCEGSWERMLRHMPMI